MSEISDLRQELEDLKSSTPIHHHTTTAGDRWSCTSPYCDRGNDVRNDPQAGPGETPAFAEIRYRRASRA